MQCTAKNQICFCNMFVRTYDMLGLFYATKVTQTKIKTKRPVLGNNPFKQQREAMSQIFHFENNRVNRSKFCQNLGISAKRGINK